MKTIPRIADLKNLEGKRVLLRVDFNVPVKDGKVVNDFRIQKTIPTINQLRYLGATVILMSHFENKAGESFDVVAKYLSDMLAVDYCNSFDKETIEKTIRTSKVGVILLPNLRNHPGEKDNSPDFAQFLAGFADIYVNEAFSVSHRQHASIVGVPKLLKGYIGLVFDSEIKNLNRAIHPKGNSLFILGGAKFDTKIPLLEKFIPLYSSVFVCGALSNSIWKAEGLEMGKSLVEDIPASVMKHVSGKVGTPSDVVVVDSKNKEHTKNIDEVAAGDTIYDAGGQTIAHLREMIAAADTVLWNGPLGYYEKGYIQSTKIIAETIAHAHNESILGGGDTVACIEEMGLMDAYTHVSTGGGAMLDYLANETLPGIEVLK